MQADRSWREQTLQQCKGCGEVNFLLRDQKEAKKTPINKEYGVSFVIIGVGLHRFLVFCNHSYGPTKQDSVVGNPGISSENHGLDVSTLRVIS